MALSTRYNPPPNWPSPPPGWTPPPGWQPDPAWGPPPNGWPLWVGERANPKAWLWAFVAAGSFYAVLLVIMAIVTGGNLNPVRPASSCSPSCLSSPSSWRSDSSPSSAREG